MKNISLIFSLIISAFSIFSCNSDENILDGQLVYNTPYELTGEANDTIQKRVKSIYDKYRVSVFFNDTISKKFKYISHKGDSVFAYERIDLGWNFTSNDLNGVKYTYKYLDTDEKKLKALDFVDSFLNILSDKMRPFTILLADTLTIKTQRETTTPQYKQNYRALVLTQFESEEEGQTVEERSQTMVTDMVLNRVLGNDKLIAEFEYVSAKDQYYRKKWLKDPGNANAPTLGITFEDLREKYSEFGRTGGRLDPNTMTWISDGKVVDTWSSYYHPSEFFDDDYFEEKCAGLVARYNRTKEEFEEIRAILVKKMGTYGFIDGWKQSPTSDSPDDSKEDMEQYIRVMMKIGGKTFVERYGGSPLVFEKFTILSDYIKKELGVELK